MAFLSCEPSTTHLQCPLVFNFPPFPFQFWLDALLAWSQEIQVLAQLMPTQAGYHRVIFQSIAVRLMGAEFGC